MFPLWVHQAIAMVLTVAVLVCWVVLLVKDGPDGRF